jgi:hypothetical protein
MFELRDMGNMWDEIATEVAKFHDTSPTYPECNIFGVSTLPPITPPEALLKLRIVKEMRWLRVDYVFSSPVDVIVPYFVNQSHFAPPPGQFLTVPSMVYLQLCVFFDRRRTSFNTSIRALQRS